MRHLVSVCLLLLLCGCALFDSPAQRALRRSPDFKAGYRDGCASAGNRGADPLANNIMRDEDAFRADKAYHSGWNTGFNSCRTNQAMGRPLPPGRGPIPDPSPGIP